MSTTPIDTWAVDLANVTHIYPWVGGEGIMAVIAIVLWLLWHVWQVKHENATYDADLQKHGSSDTIRSAVSDD